MHRHAAIVEEGHGSIDRQSLEIVAGGAQAELGGNVDIVDEENAEPGQKTTNSFEQKITQARDMAQQDPKVVANIIKDWTGANAS